MASFSLRSKFIMTNPLPFSLVRGWQPAAV